MNRSTNKTGAATGNLNNRIHPSLVRVKQELHKCLKSYGKTPRCISIVGPSGSRNSNIIADFAKDFPVVKTKTGVTRPVLVVITPSNPTLKAMASTVLLALGGSLCSGETVAQMGLRINQSLDKQDVRVVIFDQMKNLNREAANWIIGLIYSSNRPTVISGSEQVLDMFQLNYQLSRCFSNFYFLKSLN